MAAVIDVNIPDSTYRIYIEPGMIERLWQIVSEVTPHCRTMLAIDANVADAHAPDAIRGLEYAGYEVTCHQLHANESLKTLATVQQLYDTMLTARLDRRSPVIALGGGLVGDLVGFAAATFLRGLPVVHAPTTLLAMVDASVGGKTAVNFPLPPDDLGHVELGKNLVGAFWQPRAVIIDPRTLRTLAERDFRCGLAECIKHALIADAGLLTFITDHAAPIAALDTAVLSELIEHSVRIKAAIVEQDEREAGPRALLNLGHTFAHVIEPIESLDLRHGEAVSIGLCAAAHAALLTDRMTRDEAAEIRNLLTKLKLPTRLSQPVDTGQLIRAMGFDKKVADGRMRFILPRGIGSAEIVADLDREIIEAAWNAVAPAEQAPTGVAV